MSVPWIDNEIRKHKKERKPDNGAAQHIGHFRVPRGEALDEGSQHQHKCHGNENPECVPGGEHKRLQPRIGARKHQALADHKSCRACEHNHREFECAVKHHSKKSVAEQIALVKKIHKGTHPDAFKKQLVDGANTEQDAENKNQHGYLNVVPCDI